MKAINVFHKGINTMLDYSKRSNDVWDLPTLNARIINKAGKGLIVTNVNGNDYDPVNQVGIELPSGFVPIGAKEHNGVAYIILHNPTTGEGEIGTYPSPKAILSWNYGDNVYIRSDRTGFERKYKPLVNWEEVKNSRVRKPLRTTLFNFDIKNLVDIVIKEKYDGSVSLYLCDGLNFNRVINSGFNQDGAITYSVLATSIIPNSFSTGAKFFYVQKGLNIDSEDRVVINADESNYLMGYVVSYDKTTGDLNVVIDNFVGGGTYSYWSILVEKRTNYLYNTGSFPFIVSHIPLVNTIPTEGGFTIKSGGQWKSGNTFFFIRYVNDDFNRTKFLTDIGPIQIGDGDTSNLNSTCGLTGVSGDNGIMDRSDKLINLSLATLDTQYKYVEIAYIRYFGDSSRVLNQEVKLINQLYEIESDTITIKLTGFESTSEFSEGQLISSGIKELTSQSHASVNNIYFGADWTKQSMHHIYLQKYASLIVPGYDDTIQIDKTTGYKEPFYAKELVGYFRGEIYPFGIVYVFKGGLESEAYPTSCRDDYNGLSLPSNVATDMAAYRFPNITVSNLTTNDQLNILGVKLDNANSISWLNGNAVASQWFTDNIIGYYFVRGDRFKNLKYQGLMMYGCRSYIANTDTGYLENVDSIKEMYTEANKVFGTGLTFETIDDALPHGCSSISYEIGGSPAYDYFNESGVFSGNRIGAMVIPGSPDNEYAVWLGQSHKKISENQAESGCWGANRDDNENIKGGANDTVTAKGDPNGCYYNDAPKDWTKWETEGNVMPIYKGFMPNSFAFFKDTSERIMIRNYMSRAYYISKKYGFFSPDHIFDIAENINSSDKIKIFGKYSYDHNNDGTDLSHITITKINDKQVPDTYPWWWLATLGNSGVSYEASAIDVDLDKITNINKYTQIQNSKDGFVSEYTDVGFTDTAYSFNQRGTCMWYWQKNNTRPEGAGNRSMSTCKYLGVTLNSHQDDLNMSFGNIYEIDPDTIDENEFASYIDYKNIRYKKISQLLQIGNSTSASIFFKGDCYLQRTFIKQMGWRGSTWTIDNKTVSGFEKDKRETNDDQPLINSGHGLIMEFISENAINTEMRYEKDLRTFYPKTEDSKTFAVATPDLSDKTEALLINVGYNVSQSPKTYFCYTKELPFEQVRYSTRIRYSEMETEISYVDSFREIKELNYKDYDTSNGPITRVINFMDELFSVQERAINQHYVGAKEAKVETSDGSINIGTGQLLEQQVKQLSTYGSQHKWGIISTPNSLYAVDYNKRVINSVGISDSGLSPRLAAQDLSLTKGYSDRIIEQFEDFQKLTDASYVLKDTPMDGEGLYLGYDPKYKDVIFSLISQNKNITFAFNEELDAFTTDYSFVSPFYLRLSNDFYSANPQGLNEVWVHDVETRRLQFYGTSYDGHIAVVVNGVAEENNTVNFSKRYDSLEIEASETGVREITYSTLKQTGYHDNFNTNDTRFWLAPEYAEGKWKLPIQAQTTPNTPFYAAQEYLEGSDMRGEWMKVQLTFTGQDLFFLKTIITNYEISQF